MSSTINLLLTFLLLTVPEFRALAAATRQLLPVGGAGIAALAGCHRSMVLSQQLLCYVRYLTKFRYIRTALTQYLLFGRKRQ